MVYAIFHHYHHFYSTALELSKGPGGVPVRHVETEEEPPSGKAVRRRTLEESEAYTFICGVVA